MGYFDGGTSGLEVGEPMAHLKYPPVGATTILEPRRVNLPKNDQYCRSPGSYRKVSAGPGFGRARALLDK